MGLETDKSHGKFEEKDEGERTPYFVADGRGGEVALTASTPEGERESETNQ